VEGGSVEGEAPLPDGLVEVERGRRRRAVRALEEKRRRRRRRGAAGGVLALLMVAVVVGLVLEGSGRSSAQRHSTLAAARRGALAPCLGPRRPESAAILEYHVIFPAPAGAPFPLLYVPPKQFAAQMKAIAAAGYHAVTLNQLWDNWHHGGRLPCGKPIVISFDNGYEAQYQFALPVLVKLGWVGVENLQLSGLPFSQGGLSRHEIRALVKAGWELDTQGYSHAGLVGLSPSELTFQTATTRRKIQRLYHVPVNWFCYPSGEYDPTVIAALKAAGFRGSTTEVNGWAGPNDDPFALPRLEVQPTMSPHELLEIVADMRHDPPPGDSGEH
jgi:peptidoglycan/xylan/chitin deacetylase (PgdA/CDA1 family)